MINLTILGNNSAIPAHGRHPTAQIVEIKEQLFLVDCGEGTQIQMQKFNIRKKRINYIFISHLHGDHYFGLIGLITSMGLLGRTNTLTIYSPPELQKIIELILSVGPTLLPFPLVFESIAANEARTLLDTEQYTVSCFPVEHRIQCHGFLFKLKEGERKLLPEECKAHGLPTSYFNALKKGADYIKKDGSLVKNEWVTINGAPEKKYAYCADTIFTESFLSHIRNVDLLYHESTFLKEDSEKANARFHSTAEQAATIALKAGAKKLLLGHYSSRYLELDDFYNEAKETFSNVEASVEGTTYEV